MDKMHIKENLCHARNCFDIQLSRNKNYDYLFSLCAANPQYTQTMRICELRANSIWEKKGYFRFPPDLVFFDALAATFDWANL